MANDHAKCIKRCRCWIRNPDIDTLVERIVEWREEKGFKTDLSNIPEKLMLIVSELSEAMEAHRKGDPTNFREEIADVAIRLFDLCGSLYIDLPKEIASKMEFNESRPQKHGKAY